VPVQASIAVTGNLLLTAVGQSSQLTATETHVDGTASVVTTAVTWESIDEATAVVSATGLVTATGPGRSTILAYRPNVRGGLVTVTVMPPGAFTTTGRVREPGQGGVPGVQVVETQSGRRTLTDGSGYYNMVLTDPHLSFQKPGYEPAAFMATSSGQDSVPIQRVIRISAGDTVRTTLAPNDMDYVIGPDVHCYPCRLVRIGTATPGTLHVELTWTQPQLSLSLWIDGHFFAGGAPGDPALTADVPVPAGEVLLYVGMVPPNPDQAYVPLTLSTALK
jgi:hypothetical protein